MSCEFLTLLKKTLLVKTPKNIFLCLYTMSECLPQGLCSTALHIPSSSGRRVGQARGSVGTAGTLLPTALENTEDIVDLISSIEGKEAIYSIHYSIA